MKMTTRLAAVLSSILMISAFPLSSRGEDSDDQNGEEEPILVGRLSHVEGSALRYDPDEGQWVGVAEDAPFGFNDRLKTEQDGRAEIILPNNTWVRLAEETGIELVSLTEQETAIILNHGKARFISKGSDSGFAVSTPFGDVTAPGMTVFDLQIVNESAEVIPLSGSVYYRRDPTGAAIEVKEGSNGILVDKYSLAAGKRHIDPVWDGWNTERDSLWTKRMEIGAASAKYLPPALTDHAYVLQDNGVWESVYAHEYKAVPVIDAGASVLPKESERGFVSGKRKISAKNTRENGNPVRSRL